MIIKNLKIENFRGFQAKQSLSFSSRLNVFLGVNGAGKSSILDLIAIFLNQFTNKLSDINIDFKIKDLDININEKETINSISIGAPLISNIDIITNEKYHKLSWFVGNDLYNTNEQRVEDNISIKEINKRLDTYIGYYKDFIHKNPKLNIPIFKYFQAQRITEGIRNKPKPKRYLTEQLIAYNDAFNISLNFNEFITWFIEEENIENREKIKRKDFNYQIPNLQIIRNAIKIFFENFKDANYNNFRIEDRTKMTKISEKSSLVINKDGATYNLKQLSDGEKILILMVSDIASKLATTNPNDKNALKTGKGIVLIDEIDLHLHVAWQRAIIPALLETFKSVQFFITTHSPQVLGSIDKDNIFTLKDFKITKLNTYTKGRDTNSILRDVYEFSEREEYYKNEIKSLYNYIYQNDKINAKKQLDKLTNLWGDTDREIVRANMYYEDLID